MNTTLKALQILDDTPPWDWPEDTAAVLLDVLRDRSAGESERRLAAELAGNAVVINQELVHALLSILRNSDELDTVRSAAAIALGPVLELCHTDGFDAPEPTSINESTFHEIQESLRALYLDTTNPAEVRRRILEAAVRAPLAWHHGAIQAAYGDDENWRLTAVFCMRYVRGFDEQILASLESPNPDIHFEAVRAAGAWEIGAAWAHVVGLVTAQDADRSLMLAAIEAVGSIRPSEAGTVLAHLDDSDDPEIAEAVLEATSINEAWDEDEDQDLDEDERSPRSLN